MIKFTKMHGLGNDYVYIDATAKTGQKIENESDLAKFVSNRHFGIGSDGLILICDSKVADFKMRMFNYDGSEAEMCGNGIRCVGKFVYDKGLTNKESITVETLAGIKTLKFNIENSKVKTVQVDMGEPILNPQKIPVISEEKIVKNLKIKAYDKEFKFTCVSMGNPHAVTFVNDIKNFKVAEYGPILENADIFPEKANIEFVEVVDKNNIKIFKPMPAPIDKIQNRFRYRIIIKAKMTEEINEILNKYLKKVYQKDCESNAKLLLLNDSSTENTNSQAAKFMELSAVKGIVQNTTLYNQINTIVKSLNKIMIVLIVLAVLLAIVILYNLTNINVAERIRELCTIKVLGFYDKETTVLELKKLVEYQSGQVVSKTLVQNELVSVTIFSFDKDEEISTHSSGGDVMVTVLEGKGKFVLDGEEFVLEEGKTIIMPKDLPHSVYGEEKFKMLLVVSF